MNSKPRQQTINSWICLFVPLQRIYKTKARLVDHPAPAALGQGTEVLVGVTLVPTLLYHLRDECEGARVLQQMLSSQGRNQVLKY